MSMVIFLNDCILDHEVSLNKFQKADTLQVMGFPGGSDGKSICPQCGRPGFDPWVRKMPWKKKWQPTPVLLPGKFHGWRNFVGYSPWGCKESDTKPSDFTFTFHFHSNILEFLVGASGKKSACQCRRHKRSRFNAWVSKMIWRWAWQRPPVFLLGASQEQRSLVHEATNSWT